MTDIFAALDMETTGLSAQNDRVVEIAAVKFELNGRQLEAFETLTDPGIPIPAEASRIHGIDDSMVAGKPSPLEAWDTVLDWTGEITAFVAHNAPFEAGFVQSLASSHPAMANLKFVDTAQLSYALWQRPSYKLGDLVSIAGRPHRAMPDAQAVFHLLCQLVKDCPGGTVPPRYIRAMPEALEPGPTAKQLNYIRDLGGTPSQVKTKRQASDYIDRLLKK